ARRAMQGVGLACLSCLAIALLGYWSGGIVAEVLFPDYAAECQKIISISIWALPLAAVQRTMGYSLLGAGREANLTRSSVLAILSSLGVGVLLMIRLGVVGACWFL